MAALRTEVEALEQRSRADVAALRALVEALTRANGVLTVKAEKDNSAIRQENIAIREELRSLRELIERVVPEVAAAADESAADLAGTTDRLAEVTELHRRIAALEETTGKSTLVL